MAFKATEVPNAVGEKIGTTYFIKPEMLSDFAMLLHMTERLAVSIAAPPADAASTDPEKAFVVFESPNWPAALGIKLSHFDALVHAVDCGCLEGLPDTLYSHLNSWRRDRGLPVRVKPATTPASRSTH